jgi:hypothetical protein
MVAENSRRIWITALGFFVVFIITLIDQLVDPSNWVVEKIFKLFVGNCSNIQNSETKTKCTNAESNMIIAYYITGGLSGLACLIPFVKRSDNL